MFPCCWVHDVATDQLLLYYGAADTVVAMATARYSEVLARICDSPLTGRHRTSDQADAR